MNSLDKVCKMPLYIGKKVKKDKQVQIYKLQNHSRASTALHILTMLRC